MKYAKTFAGCGLLFLLPILVAGCGSGNDVTLYPVKGTVTYNGNPLANATVTFVPEAGPVAFGSTDMQGQYTLTTGGQAGAVAGPATVSISVPQAKKETTETDVDQYMATGKLPESAATPQGSPIPEKYTNAQSSGLTATVTDDSEKNTFDFSLGS